MRLALALVLVSSIAHADPKVAVIEKAKFDGGIARLLAAREQLDKEKQSFRFVESPDGKAPETPDFCKPPRSVRMKEVCDDLKKSELAARADAAWTVREVEVLDPIVTDVEKAVIAYAKSRGIELLLDKDQTEIIYIAPGVDITAAFIKDYNARYPVVKPKPPKR